MKTKIIFFTTFFLANTLNFIDKSLVFASQSLTFPQIISAYQYPRFSRTFIEHRIKIQMPENSIVSALKINIPEGVEIGDDIKVHTLENEKITVNTSINNDVITLIFPEGYQGGEILKIHLNDVDIKTNQKFLQYRATAQLMLNNIDEKMEFPIGVVSIRVRK